MRRGGGEVEIKLLNECIDEKSSLKLYFRIVRKIGDEGQLQQSTLFSLLMI